MMGPIYTQPFREIVWQIQLTHSGVSTAAWWSGKLGDPTRKLWSHDKVTGNPQCSMRAKRALLRSIARSLAVSVTVKPAKKGRKAKAARK